MKRAKLATWKDYFENTKNNPPRPLLVKALESVNKKNEALDFGSGALNDSKYFLLQNFKHVTALDKVDVAHDVAKDLPKERFDYVISSFEEFNFPENFFDIVNAQYALPFISPNQFKRVFMNMFNSLKNGGILTGQFFGDRDEWKDNPNMTFLNKEEVYFYLKDYKIIYFQEEEKDKTSKKSEAKHWHLFHFIVQKI